jgi:hypothetical protein
VAALLAVRNITPVQQSRTRVETGRRRKIGEGSRILGVEREEKEEQVLLSGLNTHIRKQRPSCKI